MPVYEYHCKKCNDNFEVWRAATETSAQKCPVCNTKAQKVFHAPGIIFKGSGFHVNDYTSKGAKDIGTPATTCPKAADNSCPGCAESK